ncbi:MAG: hypothetical protein ACREE9_03490 [Stellaceae bacterium]
MTSAEIASAAGPSSAFAAAARAVAASGGEGARPPTVSLSSLTMRAASRIQSAGKGDSDPRYTPPDLPANRARNRRVEIEQLRGS